MALSSGDNPKAGQVTATTTPGSLGSQACSAVLVQNDPGSTQNVAVGDSSHQYVALKPGQSLTVPCSNVSQVYVTAASGSQTVNWLAIG